MFDDNHPIRSQLPAPQEAWVWVVAVNETFPSLPELEKFLSPDERAARDRLVRPKDRLRYGAAHGMLRLLLARCLAVAPHELGFVRGKFGKPALAATAGRASLEFNLSHSGEFVLIGIAVGRRIGVDVERVRANLDVPEVAASQFSPEEIAALHALPVATQRAAFFRAWTRKEAFVKARGEGMSFPLASFSVEFGEDRPPAVRAVEGDATEASRWSVTDVSPAEDHTGAAVVEGAGVRWRKFRWRTPRHWSTAIG